MSVKNLTTSTKPTTQPQMQQLPAQDPALQKALMSMQQLQRTMAQQGVRTQADFVARFAQASQLSALMGFQQACKLLSSKSGPQAVGTWIDAAIAKIKADGLKTDLAPKTQDAADLAKSLAAALADSDAGGLPRTGLLDEHVSNLTQITKEVAGKKAEEVKTAWSNYLTQHRPALGKVDINAFVQAVLQQSYMETTKDLRFFAEKVKWFNELKKSIRSEMSRGRDFLLENAGLADDALMEHLFFGKTFNADFMGPDSPLFLEGAIEALRINTPGGEELVLSPEMLEKPGLWEAVREMQDGWSLNPADYAASCTGKQGGSVVNSFYYFLALNSLIQGHQDDYKPEQLVKDLKDQFGIDCTLEGEGAGVTIKFPDGTTFVDASGNGGMGEADLNFDKALVDLAADLGLDEAGYDLENAFKDVKATEFMQEMQDLMDGTGGEYPEDALLEMVALAYMYGEAGIGTSEEGVGKPMSTKGEVQNYVQDLEEKLQSVGDDAQLANVDLQNILQKQQQTLQMMSNMSKMLHDTAMAIIRKISG